MALPWDSYSNKWCNFRTLLNQLLSQACLISCFAGVAYTFSFIWIILINVRSTILCHQLIFVGRLNFFLFITGLLARQLTKFLYIFKWSFVNGIDEDFAARLMLCWNIMAGIIVGIVSFFLGFHSTEVPFHVCNKMIPTNETSCYDIRAQAQPVVGNCTGLYPTDITCHSLAHKHQL